MPDAAFEGERWLTDGTPPSSPHYTRAGVGELIPGPCSPLGWTLVWEQGIVPGWRDALPDGGRPEGDRPEHQPPLCASFGGYVYVDRSCARASAALAGTGGGPEGPHGWRRQRDRAAAARRARTDLTYLTPAELVGRARSLLPLLREVYAAAVTAGAWSLDGTGNHGAGGAGESDRAAKALWALSRVVAASDDLELYFDGGVPGILERLAGSPSDEAKTFLDDFDTLLYEHGSLGPGQWDIAGEVWETDPELALGRLERLRRRPDREAPGGGAAPAAEGDPSAALATGSALRVVNEIRIALREAGRQMAAAHHLRDAGLVMMLTAGELDDFLATPSAYGLKLAERAAGFAALAVLEPPSAIEGAVPPLAAWPRRAR